MCDCYGVSLLPGVGGEVASWLARSSPGSSGAGSRSVRGHCVVLLGKTLYSHSTSLQPGV